MKQLKSTRIIKPHIQQELFLASPDPPANQSISVYRVSLVKDESVSFGNVRLANSQEAQALIQNLILTKGQPDREQFVVALLNAKNELTGLNIVSVGGLSSAPVHPREVLKPAILANSAAMIIGPQPSFQRSRTVHLMTSPSPRKSSMRGRNHRHSGPRTPDHQHGR
jgi:hypothetical protein